MGQDSRQIIRLGISSCLLGNEVRHDGGHKHDTYITGTLAKYFEFVPICPEVECGLTIPRESMRLVGNIEAPRLVTDKTGHDHTERMNKWALLRIAELQEEELCGFIFKAKSPSSGMERVKIYDIDNVPRAIGEGLFARAFKLFFPLLPMEDEGRLNDMVLRENFIESIFIYRRWRKVVEEGSLNALVEFHGGHKLLLMAHSQSIAGKLTKMAARAGMLDKKQLFGDYQEGLLSAMKLKPTLKKHIKVLMHIMRRFKKVLSAEEKQEMLRLIEEYRNHSVPLVVVVTLINHYARKYSTDYLLRQYYLNPHPIELKLKNHV